jgi:hypothetical protein
LVLERVGQLVREHRFLLVDVHPVQHVHGFGLRVVVGLDLLFEELQQKRLELKVVVQQAELFEHNLVALQAFRALIFIEFFFEVAFHGGTSSEGALDRVFDRQAGLVGGELHQLVHKGEELLRLFGGDVGCAGGVRSRRFGLCSIRGRGLRARRGGGCRQRRGRQAG